MKGVPKNSPWRIQEAIDRATELERAIHDPAQPTIFPLNKKAKHSLRNVELETVHAPVMAWVYAHEEFYPALRFMFHTPSEGRRGYRQQNAIKQMGVRKGVPDLMLPLPTGCAYKGIAMELKAPGKKPTPEQAAFLIYLRHAGWYADVIHDPDRAIAHIKALVEGGYTQALFTTSELERIAAKAKANGFTDTL